MRRILVLGLTGAVLALTGCTGDSGELDSSDGKSGGVETSAQEKPTAKDGDDYDACSDADCEVEVRESATLPLDEEFGIDTFEITIAGDELTARAEIAGGYSRISFTGKGSAIVQGIVVSAESIVDGEAIVSLTPQ